MTILQSVHASIFCVQQWIQETPAPPQIDPDQVTSGPLGFLFIAVLALAVIGLCIPMARTLRRIGYRAEVQEQIAAELAAKRATVDDAAQQ